MTLPFKPHIIALACSAGLFVGAGVLYVNSRTPEAPSQPAPAAAPQPTVAENNTIGMAEMKPSRIARK